MNKDFTQYKIDLKQRRGSIIVEAKLNGHLNTSLIVDTGATIVLLAPEIADKLGVIRKDSFSFFATLANGEKVKAYPVLLESVTVGEATVKNVQAAVLEKSQPGLQNGLLGMSFLGNFTIRIDAKTNTLLLETFSP